MQRLFCTIGLIIICALAFAQRDELYQKAAASYREAAGKTKCSARVQYYNTCASYYDCLATNHGNGSACGSNPANNACPPCEADMASSGNSSSGNSGTNNYSNSNNNSSNGLNSLQNQINTKSEWQNMSNDLDDDYDQKEKNLNQEAKQNKLEQESIKQSYLKNKPSGNNEDYSAYHESDEYEKAEIMTKLANGDYTGAIEQLSNIQSPTEDDINNLSLAYFNAGSKDKAIDILEKNLLNDPDNEWAKSALTDMKLDYAQESAGNGNYEAAIEEMESIKDEFEDDPRFLNNLGYVYDKKGNRDKAAEYYWEAADEGEISAQQWVDNYAKDNPEKAAQLWSLDKGAEKVIISNTLAQSGQEISENLNETQYLKDKKINLDGEEVFNAVKKTYDKAAEAYEAYIDFNDKGNISAAANFLYSSVGNTNPAIEAQVKQNINTAEQLGNKANDNPVVESIAKFDEMTLENHKQRDESFENSFTTDLYKSFTPEKGQKTWDKLNAAADKMQELTPVRWVINGVYKGFTNEDYYKDWVESKEKLKQ